jgi:hypothetical protein
MKIIFDKHTKEEDFKVDDLVLKWDARNEDKGKHGKFDHLWMGPFRIVAYHGKMLIFYKRLMESSLVGGL